METLDAVVPEMALPYIIAAVLALNLGVGILLYERFSPASRRFAGATILVGGFFAALASRTLAQDAGAVEFWWRIAAALQVLTPPALYALATHLTGSPRQRRVRWVLAVGVGIAVWAVARPEVAAGLRGLAWQDFGAPHVWAAALLIAYMVAVLAAVMVEFLVAWRRARTRLDARRNAAMLLAMAVGALALGDYVWALPVVGAARLSTIAVTLSLLIIGVAQVRYWAFAEYSGYAPSKILSALADAVLVCDEAGLVRVANPAAVRLAGGQTPLVGRRVANLVRPAEEHGGGPAPGGDWVEEAVSGRGVRNVEFLLHTASGEDIPLSVSVEPLTGTDLPGGFVLVGRDLRDRLAAQAALAETEKRYRSLFWHNPAVAYEIGLDGTIHHVNPAGAALLEVEPESVVGRNFAEVMAPDAVAATQEMFARVLAGEPQQYELDVVTATGGRKTIRGVSIPVMAGEQVTSVFGVALDVTEEARWTRELDVQRRYFAELFEGSPEAIAIINEDGVVRRVNDEFTRLFGYSKEEAVGRILDHLIVPEDQVEEADRLGRLAVEGRLMRAELVRRRKVGGLVEVSLLARRIQVPGEELQVYAIYRDVTDQKRMEEKLREREEELRHAQRLEAVGKLAGGIAHDFNNLLTVINGHARFALDERKADDGVRADLEEIERAGIRAASLTQQLLAFSRRQVLRPVAVDLNLVVREMERMLRRLIGTHIRLDVDLAHGLPPILADRGQVEQVVMNLVVNARDAMPEGGVLTVRTSPVHFGAGDPNLAQWEMEPGEYVNLEVRDTGHGMTPDVVARAFDPFFTTKEQGRGTGLGLATVFGIMKQSRGHVTVQSAAGEGARFDVYLPTAGMAQDGAPGEPRPQEPERSAPGGVVLVVEDEASVRRLAARVLVRKGYEVLEAANGVEALELAGGFRDRIDVLLTDLVMPEMGGRELARHFRTKRPETAILFMSGYDDELSTAGTGDDPFMKTPFTPTELVDRVDALRGAGTA
jgi:two-component system, cell cycle sensor histidine kinase and response regulator CckA